MNLEIFILCHNRPVFAREAIKSALQQNSSQYRLVISDNSTDDSVEEMVKIHFPMVEYRRRSRHLPALEHFNTCIDEVSADYFCLFHDDDIMFPEFVAEVQKAIVLHPLAVAIGTNAKIKDVNKSKTELFFASLGIFEVIASPQDLFSRYFGRFHSGIAPFPGYVYRAAAIGSTRLPTMGGKYADVSWLLQIAAKGKIVLLELPLFEYRLHGGNDGLQESLADRISLLSFLKSHRNLCGSHGLADYRYFLHRKLMASDGLQKFPRRRKTIDRFVLKHKISRLFRKKDFLNLIERGQIKQRIKRGRQ